MQVNVLSRDSLVLERMLIDSEIDLALTDGPIEHPLLASHAAFDERLVLLMPALGAAAGRRNPGTVRVLYFQPRVFFPPENRSLVGLTPAKAADDAGDGSRTRRWQPA
jgi:DNA-binding transcriptional LysR family regulator